jgi:hypothetical protein
MRKRVIQITFAFKEAIRKWMKLNFMRRVEDRKHSRGTIVPVNSSTWFEVGNASDYENSTHKSSISRIGTEVRKW